MPPPRDEQSPGDEPRDSDHSLSLETSGYHTGGITGDGSGRPDISCVMCDLVADTQRLVWDGYRQGDLDRYASAAHTIDLAGTHQAAAP